MSRLLILFYLRHVVLLPFNETFFFNAAAVCIALLFLFVVSRLVPFRNHVFSSYSLLSAWPFSLVKRCSFAEPDDIPTSSLCSCAFYRLARWRTYDFPPPLSAPPSRLSAPLFSPLPDLWAFFFICILGIFDVVGSSAIFYWILHGMCNFMCFELFSPSFSSYFQLL